MDLIDFLSTEIISVKKIMTLYTFLFLTGFTSKKNANG